MSPVSGVPGKHAESNFIVFVTTRISRGSDPWRRNHGCFFQLCIYKFLIRFFLR
jgi:hypothetical protein